MENNMKQETLKKIDRVLKLVENTLKEEDQTTWYDSSNEHFAIDALKKYFTSNGLQAPNVKIGKEGKWEKTEYKPKLDGVAKILFKNINAEISAYGNVEQHHPKFKNHSLIRFSIHFSWEYNSKGSNGDTINLMYDITDKKWITEEYR